MKELKDYIIERMKNLQKDEDFHLSAMDTDIENAEYHNTEFQRSYYIYHELRLVLEKIERIEKGE